MMSVFLREARSTNFTQVPPAFLSLVLPYIGKISRVTRGAQSSLGGRIDGHLAPSLIGEKILKSDEETAELGIV